MSAGPARPNDYIITRSGRTFWRQSPISNCTPKSQRFSHHITMSDLLPGKYRILPAGISAPPPFPIGANIVEADPTVSPVISAGASNVWNVAKRDSGNYILSLMVGGNWFSKDEGGNVVVVPESAAGEWTIQRRDDYYTIEVRGFAPTKAWYLASTVPGTEVTLRLIDEISPAPQQLWTFIPAN
ncbi:hypothetical protein L210DRAFT_974185 [Boletus edulis BED1]|uniref:Uncharacterized protein n=1 Tax=Boletus edulis BED1 TaxID=1328754 RepID=A0AAD4G8K0_BOLED|nr:hypothetical protein L210DRAFT_974185 [Boletus edulis BED1]